MSQKAGTTQIRKRMHELLEGHYSMSELKEVTDALTVAVAELFKGGSKINLFDLATLDYKHVKPIKKGTMVYNPGTKAEQPSKGRAEALGATARPGAQVKKSVPGVTTKAGKEIIAQIKAKRSK